MSVKKEPVKRMCAECGKEFMTNSTNRLYCSAECRKVLTRRKARERYVPKTKPLTVRGWIPKNGVLVPFESLTEAEHAAWLEQTCKRLSVVLSEHYSTCSEEEAKAFFNSEYNYERTVKT